WLFNCPRPHQIKSPALLCFVFHPRWMKLPAINCRPHSMKSFMRTQITITSTVILFVSLSALADDTLNIEGGLPLKKEYQERQQRVSQWYAPARFGLFCHWGLFTGSSNDNANVTCYNSIAEFEAAADDPDVIASNIVATAELMGARYITFSLLHSDDRHAVLFPAKTPGFKLKTTKDYIGALA